MENIFYGDSAQKTFFSNTVETVTFGDKFGYVVLITESIPAEASTPQNITYTDFNKMLSITQGSKSHQLLYGVNNQRIKGTFKTSGTTKLTRYYMGNYEEEINATGNIRKLHYINGGNGLAAIMVRNGGVDSLYYTYCDYQGNLLAVTDAAGNVKERYAYDPWGQRVNPADWTQKDTRTSFLFSRGYTLHEHLDDFGLINMNGRMYDPLVAQFLSPDPYVQAPDNWFNYNRYAYGMNNPLLYSDPSGEFIFTALLTPIGLTPLGVIIDGACWGAVIGGGAYTVSAALTPGGLSQNWNSNDFWHSVGSGAVSGAVFAGMGLIAPSFTVSSTSFTGNLPAYLGKAGYAALTGGLSAGAGMMTGDYLDDGKINTPFKEYMKGMGIAAATSGLISFGGSVYDYATWDRFTPAQKITRLQKEFDISIQYDAANTTSYGYFDPNISQSKLFITDNGLQSRSIARSTVAHELQHYHDFQNYIAAPIRSGNTPSMTNNTFLSFTDRNAYSLELRMANKYALSMNEWIEGAAGARYYKAALSSYYNFNLLMLLRNIY